GGHLAPLGAGPEPSDRPLELLPQPLGIRTVLAYRQVRLNELPLLVGELPTCHTQRPTRSCPRTGPEPALDHDLTPTLALTPGRGRRGGPRGRPAGAPRGRGLWPRPSRSDRARRRLSGQRPAGARRPRPEQDGSVGPRPLGHCSRRRRTTCRTAKA